jgi:hypothetical protein
MHFRFSITSLATFFRVSYRTRTREVPDFGSFSNAVVKQKLCITDGITDGIVCKRKIKHVIVESTNKSTVNAF